MIDMELRKGWMHCGCALTLSLTMMTTDVLGANNSTKEKSDEDDSQDKMINGLLIGFGGFVAFITLICVIWCCCCGKGKKDTPLKAVKRPQRIAPSPSPSATPLPPTRHLQSEPSTRSTTAESRPPRRSR